MVNSIIAKANGNKKVIDFRDKLVAAKQDDYAQMHGVGGKNHSPNSTIQCMICDYSKGTGDKSVSVKTNINVDTVYYIYENVRKVLFKNENDSELTITAMGQSKMREAYKMLKEYKEKGIASEDKINTVLTLITEAGKEIRNGLSGEYDFTYTQDKVDIYKKTADGKAPVTKLTISHQPLYNGKKSNYPWFIKITNGIAPIKEQDGGTVSYIGAQLQKTGEAFINVSDADIFRMISRVIRYIETWENAIVLPNIISGLQKREDERQNWQNSMT